MELRVQLEKRLPGFTLEVAFETHGEPLGILGASGAGKTMTLRAIAGLETSLRGSVTLGGHTLFDSATHANVPARARHIGMMFQHYALFPHLTVAENIAFGSQGLAGGSRSITDQISRVGLQGLEQRYPRQLSGGQQQRTALARALASNPEALLLDEPLSALDPHLRSAIERQLASALGDFRGPSLYVSHNLEEIYRLCPDLLVLHQGRVVARGPKDEIFSRPPNAITARLTGCKNFSRAQRAGDHEVEALDWGVRLRVNDATRFVPRQVAIRANHLALFSASQQFSGDRVNVFPCWVTATSETPFRMTVYLRLGVAAVSAADFHLQAEISKDKFAELRDQPQPWRVWLNPEKIFLLPD
jgi:molybdate transport system permease protein